MHLQEPARILLAEDNPADRRLISEALNTSYLTHVLDVADNGEQAVRMALAAGHDESPVRT